MNYKVRQTLIVKDVYEGSKTVCRLLSGVIAACEAAEDLNDIIEKRKKKIM